jgi:ABC-2 type transport system permease protein
MWRKDWVELRWLTLLACAVVVGGTLLFLGDPSVYGRHAAVGGALLPSPAETFIQYNSRSLAILVPVLVGSMALLLGIGGLGHERSGGTASFTLVLPYSRRVIVMSRFLTGAAVVVTLAVAAHLTASLWAAFHHPGSEYPVRTAAGMSLCLAAGSLAVYAFMFFVANVTANTVRAVATSVVLLAILAYYAGSPFQTSIAGTVSWWLLPLNVFKLMSGGGFLFSGTLPWLGIADAFGVTVAFGYVTARWVERHDF